MIRKTIIGVLALGAFGMAWLLVLGYRIRDSGQFESQGQYLGSPIVSIQSGLRQEYLDWSICCHVILPEKAKV